MPSTVRLSSICLQAGVSDATARRYLRDHNAMRACRGWHRFDMADVPGVLALIEAKRQRRCRNAFNSSPRAPQGAGFEVGQ